MKQTTARKLADAGRKYIDEIVTFPDFHGRWVTGKLEAVDAPASAAYAVLKVEGREYGIFANTLVDVTEPLIEVADSVSDSSLGQAAPSRSNTCPCVHCKPFLDAPHGNGCSGYHCSGSCIL